jgi:hypothetical protein
LRHSCRWVDWGSAGVEFKGCRIATTYISHSLVFVALVGVCSIVRFRHLLVLAVATESTDWKDFA